MKVGGVKFFLGGVKKKVIIWMNEMGLRVFGVGVLLMLEREKLKLLVGECGEEWLWFR